jgi:hypothetical protein
MKLRLLSMGGIISVIELVLLVTSGLEVSYGTW